MPRQVILSALEREALLASPANRDELIRWYTFSEADSALIRQRRGGANRLGFAVQLCLLRYPGQGLAVNTPPGARAVFAAAAAGRRADARERPGVD